MSQLNQNTEDLQELLDAVNNLPTGSGGGSSEEQFTTVSLSGISGDEIIYVNKYGEVVKYRSVIQPIVLDVKINSPLIFPMFHTYNTTSYGECTLIHTYTTTSYHFKVYLISGQSSISVTQNGHSGGDVI